MATVVAKLRQELKTDPYWIKLRNMTKTAYDPKFDTYLEEMAILHKSRLSRQLASDGFPTGKKVGNAAAKDIAVRSRCVEMCIEVVRIRNWLHIYMNNFRKHIETSKADWFKSNGVTTITARRDIVSVLLARSETAIEQLDTVTEVADLIIKDCDQTGFSTKHIISALEIATRREG